MKKIFVILIVSVLSASLFGQLNYDRTNNTLTIGGSESKIVLQGTTGSVTLRSLPTAGGTVLIPSVVGFDTIATRQFVTALLNSFSAMVYPSAGIPVSTGTGWATSITDNSVNWNTAFSQTLQWDGSNINLNAEAGRSSLGGTTVGQAIFTLPNPSGIRFLRINADNSVSALKAADFKKALSLTSSDVSLGNVTNESKTTMFTSPVFTGTIPRYGSPVSDTLATRAYARSVSEYSGGGGGGTWGLITGNITEQADLSEVFGTKIDTGTVYTKAATNTLLSQKLSLSDTSAMLAPYPLTKSLPIDNWNTAYGWGDHSLANYINSTTATSIAEGVLEDALEDAPIGVAVEDVVGGTTGRDRYMSPAQIESYVAQHAFSGGEIIKFTVGDPGAPVADEDSFSHSALAGKQIVLLRDGIESDYTYASGEITVIPSWQENEKIRLYLWPANTWEDLSLETSIEQGLINSLIGYWKLDEGSGSTAVDEMSNSNGTVYGGTWVTGVINNGFEVSSASDAIYIPSNEDNLIDGPFSISFWVNLDEIASVRETDVSLFNTARSTTPNTTSELYIPQSGAHQDNFYFSSRNEAGNWFSAISVTAVTANTWYHIVAANGGNGEYLDIYINGVRDNKIDQAFTGDIRPADLRYVIGSGFTGSTQYGAGIYDEVMIFHRVLSALEVEYLYNDGQGRQLTIP